MPPRPPTLKAIAESLDLTVRRVSELKREGMPVNSIEAAVQWKTAREGQATSRRDTAELLRQRRIELLAEQTRRARIEADKAAGLLVERREAEADFTRIGFMVRAGMQRLAAELPNELVGLDAPAMQRVIQARGDEILLGLAEGRFDTCGSVSPE